MSTRTAAGAKTLPGRYYTSETVYRRESERIFGEKWLYAGRAGRITAPGDYFLFENGSENLIILRDRRGQIRAFHNLCRHRGTRLCKAPEGRFSSSIQCPYHAWTYRLDGELSGAPNMHEVEGFAKSDYPLLPAACAEWEGGIFVNFGENPEPFTEAYAAVHGKFSIWHLPELEVAHRIEYTVRANWKLIMQNYSECYHCPSLHPALNRLTPYRNSSNDLEAGLILGGPMHLARPGGSMTMSGLTCAPPLGEITGEALNSIYYYVFFPNFLLSLHPDYVLTHRLDRLAADRTRVICEWLFHPDAMARPEFDPSGAIEFWNMTNRQDWEVCELSQQGVESRAYRPGPYAELESMIAAFDRTYLEALGELQG